MNQRFSGLIDEKQMYDTVAYRLPIEVPGRGTQDLKSNREPHNAVRK